MRAWFRYRLTQQAGARGVPQAGVSGVDVGHGQYVKVIQARLVAD
jgi:hypothetical protein